jgi:hypothetical protein
MYSLRVPRIRANNLQGREVAIPLTALLLIKGQRSNNMTRHQTPGQGQPGHNDTIVPSDQYILVGG